MTVTTPEPTMINGKPAYNIGQAADYLGVRRTAISNILTKNHIDRYKLGFGQERYVLIEDLDKLKRAQVVEPGEE